MKPERGGSIIEVGEEMSGVRIDSALYQLRPDFTRTAWQKHLKAGKVAVDGRVVKPSQLLHGGEQLVVEGEPDRQSIEQIASASEIPIIYEDDDVLVINKPSGLITHPKLGSHEPSVSGSMLARVQDMDNIRPGIVHRLDKDTSGVMIIAKHQSAKQSLQAAFKARAVTKEYFALVHGQVSIGVQRIHFGLSRSTRKATQMEVDPLGKPSETYIQNLTGNDAASLVLARPTTGRTHQIRVHLAALQHPIVGDDMYGQRENKRYRLMLHAYSLKLPLPNGKIQTFVVPPGEDFMSVLADFHIDYQVQ